MSRKAYTVACLAGHGVGPELMAEASRTLSEVSRLHGLRIHDLHVPFGAEALARAGHPLPHSTRAAYLEADAVLVADTAEPALQDVESELDLRASVVRVTFAGGGFTLLSPLSADADAWTVARAFESARSSRGRLASIDPDGAFAELVDATADENPCVLVEHLSVAAGLPALAFEPERFDVVVTGALFADALADIASSLPREGRVAARGRLAGNGPSIFAPCHGSTDEQAGHGVADPSSMLLATALLLAEGLREHAAAETLLGALDEAGAGGARTLDRIVSGVAATTRQFTDAVLSRLPVTVATAEFAREGSR